MADAREMTFRPTLGVTPDTRSGSIFFVGTATVILRYGDLTVLTDPNFLHAGDHAHLGYGLTSRRLTDPAIDIVDLPPLDFCILSHFHGDHFDHVCERRLDKELPIVTNGHAATELGRRGFLATRSLATWESVKITKGDTRMRITSMPGRHAPGLLNALLPQVMGSMVELGVDSRERAFLYITGDTLVFEGLKEIARRYPEIDLSLIHLGGTRILNMLKVTMDAGDGIRLMNLLRPRTAIPIHYDDYTVFKDPLDNFKRAVERAGLADRVKYLERGETYRFLLPGGQEAGQRKRAV